MNGFQANVAPSEAAGLPAACLAKRCAGMSTNCGGKYHVDGVYIILSVHKADDRVCGVAQTCAGRQAPRRRRLPDPWGGFQTSASHAAFWAWAAAASTMYPQRPQGGRQLLASPTFSCAGVGHAAKRGVAKAPRPAASAR